MGTVTRSGICCFRGLSVTFKEESRLDAFLDAIEVNLKARQVVEDLLRVKQK